MYNERIFIAFTTGWAPCPVTSKPAHHKRALSFLTLYLYLEDISRRNPLFCFRHHMPKFLNISKVIAAWIFFLSSEVNAFVAS